MNDVTVIPQDDESNNLPATPANPMAMVAAAIDKGLDPNSLEKLMDLQERYEENLSRAAFEKAMAKFQAECPTVAKTSNATIHSNRTGNTHGYKYATLDQIMDTIRPILKKCGLSVRFDTVQGDNTLTAMCKVGHKDGHVETSSFVAPIDENMSANDTQKQGSASSYARRYALCNALNIATGEDDDGKHAHETTNGENMEPEAPLDFMMPFGKHKGLTLRQIIVDEHAIGYVEWLAENANRDDTKQIAQQALEDFREEETGQQQIDEQDYPETASQEPDEPNQDEMSFEERVAQTETSKQLAGKDTAGQQKTTSSPGNGNTGNPELAKYGRAISLAPTLSELTAAWNDVPEHLTEKLQNVYYTRMKELTND